LLRVHCHNRSRFGVEVRRTGCSNKLFSYGNLSSRLPNGNYPAMSLVDLVLTVGCIAVKRCYVGH
jgi:hypothetical protein